MAQPTCLADEDIAKGVLHGWGQLRGVLDELQRGHSLAAAQLARRLHLLRLQLRVAHLGQGQRPVCTSAAGTAIVHHTIPMQASESV